MAGDVRDRRFFDYDAFAGVTEFFYYDPDTKGFSIEAVQDVEPLIEVAKAVSNDAANHWRGDLHHVASLPSVIVLQLMKEGILAGPGKVLDEPRFKRWLNDRNNRVWRTKPGVV